MTTTKKCLKNATGTQKKRSLETDYQDDDEIIDIDEVRKRNGITGEKNTISLPVFALITKMTGLIPT
mgnify:FL=1